VNRFATTRLSMTLLALSITASLAGCGGSKSDDDPNVSAPSKSASASPSATAHVITEPQAKAALLNASDLPAGFVVDKEYTYETIPGGCPAVDAAVAAEKAASPTYVVASFDKGDNGFSVDEEIALFSDATKATALLDQYNSAFTSCGTWKATQDQVTGTLSVREKSQPTLGDKAEEYVVTATAGNETFGGIERAIVVGNALVFVTESGPAGAQDDPKVDLPALSSALVDRLAAG
jgi:uncharacterized protein YceK